MKKYRHINIIPSQGDFIVLTSDWWIIFDQGEWRTMSEDEQIEASK